MSEALRKPRISFHRKLLLSIVTTFLIFGVCISFFQYKREKAFRIDLMTDQLQSYNNLVYETLREKGVCDSCIINVVHFLKVQDLRVTIVNYSGDVLFDSKAKHLGNHADRPEIKAALAMGKGISVRRLSKTTGQNFFYAATRYPDYIIRCSRPYDRNLYQQLSVDYNFLIFTILLLLILLYYIFKTTGRLGKTIEQLRDFAESADKDQPLDVNQEFPKNELGEISQHIVSLFGRIKSTRDDLMVEREKLIAHLQSAREGLAVFTPDKKELIANNVFIQYINLISDQPVESAKAIFELKELNDISQFIEQHQTIRHLLGHQQQHAIQVEKNGKSFQVQCIIFQDRSFEVSINDITLVEEKSSLKRQLTQNIAHELKTPVSSIQGYMETIIDNPDLPADKLKSFVERSYLQSKRLSELLRDISTLTRMDDAPRMIEKEEVNLSRLIEQIGGELEAEMAKKDIKLITDVDPAIIVRGNSSLLYSIFRNLMDNAIAYGGEGIEIGITCFRDDPERCFFQFYDTGTGVAEEHLNRIFDRFYRVDKGRTRKLGGTGLGLAIVKNAVIHHGGTISAKNRPEGGLEFVFSLAKQP